MVKVSYTKVLTLRKIPAHICTLPLLYVFLHAEVSLRYVLTCAKKYASAKQEWLLLCY